MTRRITTASALLLLGALALSGCASTPGASSSPTPTAPATGEEIEVDAAWLDGGSMIGLVTQGSSTCVPAAGEVTLEADGTLSVVLEEVDPGRPCTRDYVSRVTLVGLPEGVDPTKELEIRVTGAGLHGDTDLDGVPALAHAEVPEYSPTAGWVDDDEIVVLTWGSSSCAPVVADVKVTDPAGVTVTFVDPPADQICTADMAPRAVVIHAPGLDDDLDVALTLAGGGAEFATPVTIPVF